MMETKVEVGFSRGQENRPLVLFSTPRRGCTSPPEVLRQNLVGGLGDRRPVSLSLFSSVIVLYQTPHYRFSSREIEIEWMLRNLYW